MKNLLNFSLLLSVITAPLYSVNSDKIEKNVQMACQQVGDSIKRVGNTISDNSHTLASKTAQGVQNASNLAKNTVNRVSTDLETAAQCSKIKARKTARKTCQGIKDASQAVKNTAQDVSDDIEYNYNIAKHKSCKSCR
ncbi:MAG: hypothetical protein P4L22_03140 [Candidatus Babeliales bacterium]|nr:hypothetical protein [Candidatus Babeliales bacterium]